MEDPDQFIRDQAKRKRKSVQNKKAQNKDQFRKEKSSLNRKAEEKK